MKKILLIATLLLTSANPAFCFDQEPFIFISVPTYVQTIYSPNSTHPAAKTSNALDIGVGSIKTLWGGAFGISLDRSLNIVDGGQTQYLDINDGAKKSTFLKKSGNHSMRMSYTISLNLQALIGHKTENPIRFFAGIEAMAAVNLYGKDEIYLTHDINRSPACATAVQNLAQDSQLGPYAVRASCAILQLPSSRAALRTVAGIDWFFEKNFLFYNGWKMSLLLVNEPDYEVNGYRISKEPYMAVVIGGKASP